MVTSSPHGVFPKLPVRWRSLAWHGFTGFLFGYVVLHPASMVIFHWLDPRMAEQICQDAAGDLFAPIADSFTLHMLPMGFVFGVIGALIAMFYSYHRLAICFQRDRLAEELRLNEKLRAELARHAERLRHNNEELAALELANRRTTQFMAHDFKTALSCVGGFAHQLLEQPALREDPEVADALVCIRRQAHRMMGSVLDLLQLARLREKGKLPMQPLLVAEVLREAASDFSLPAHAQHITLGDEHRHCPPVVASGELLRRVLCNLICNALKHNGPNTRVWIDAQVEPSGREILFSCRDDGGGVPPEVLPSLFCRFTAANSSTNGSTGLGLAFCKAAVEAHWGRIWCENLTQGSRFCFTIPLDQERADEQGTFDI